MAKDEKKKTSNIDIWLIMVIVLLVLSIGGGLWLTGQSLLARLDVLSTQTRSQLGRLETETFEMRKQLQTIEFQLRQQARKGPVEPPAAPTEEAKKPADAAK